MNFGARHFILSASALLTLGTALVATHFNTDSPWFFIGLALNLTSMGSLACAASSTHRRGIEEEFEHGYRTGYRAGHRAGRKAPQLAVVTDIRRDHGRLPKASVRAMASNDSSA